MKVSAPVSAAPAPAAPAEDLRVDAPDGLVCADDLDRQGDVARHGLEAGLVIAALEAHAHAQLGHARLVVGRDGDVEAHHGAPLVDGDALPARELEAAQNGARIADGADADPRGRLDSDLRRDVELARRAVGLDVEAVGDVERDRRLDGAAALRPVDGVEAVDGDVGLRRGGGCSPARNGRAEEGRGQAEEDCASV